MRTVAINTRAMLAVTAIAISLATSLTNIKGTAASEGRKLSVGVGQEYATIQEAYDIAQPGDSIDVYPSPEGQPYKNVAILVRKPEIVFRAIQARGVGIIIDGKDVNYSGEDGTPRAIFQLDPEADGCRLEGFALMNAHNASHNGAGVRINGANNVTVTGCEISGCDMGIMSNGKAGEAIGQRIVNCQIERNGCIDEPGYSHNLYLGGESVMVFNCSISQSLAGHNLKSRARFNWIEACQISRSANRELDIVDDGEMTGRPGADAVVIGCTITKDETCTGNRGVIHFGQDIGGTRAGTLYLINCTISTPFETLPVIMSSPSAKAYVANCLFVDEVDPRFPVGWSFDGKTSVIYKTCGHTAGFSPNAAVPNKSPANFGTPLSRLRIPYRPGETHPPNEFWEFTWFGNARKRNDAEKPCLGAHALYW